MDTIVVIAIILWGVFRFVSKSKKAQSNNRAAGQDKPVQGQPRQGQQPGQAAAENRQPQRAAVQQRQNTSAQATEELLDRLSAAAAGLPKSTAELVAKRKASLAKQTEATRAAQAARVAKTTQPVQSPKAEIATKQTNANRARQAALSKPSQDIQVSHQCKHETQPGLNFDYDSLVQAIIMAEVLGPPKALQARRS